jgi:uncharacterized membrane protein YagU involved in acid resistance
MVNFLCQIAVDMDNTEQLLMIKSGKALSGCSVVYNETFSFVVKSDFKQGLSESHPCFVLSLQVILGHLRQIATHFIHKINISSLEHSVDEELMGVILEDVGKFIGNVL